MTMLLFIDPTPFLDGPQLCCRRSDFRYWGNHAGGGVFQSSVAGSPSQIRVVERAAVVPRATKGRVHLGLFNFSEIPHAKALLFGQALPGAVRVCINYDAAMWVSSLQSRVRSRRADTLAHRRRRRVGRQPDWSLRATDHIGF
jgi:hypothetical protein